MFAKKSGRASYRSNRRTNFKKNNSSFSSYRPRSKGNVSQLYDKYVKLAKESASSGDRIQSEYYYQFADHYSRLMSELGLKSQEVDNSFEKTVEQNLPNEDKTNEVNDKNIFQEENEKSKSDNLEDEDNSLESVSFIAKPAKKKSTKTNKDIN